MPPAKCGVGDYTNKLVKELSTFKISIDIVTDIKFSNGNETLKVNSWSGLRFYRRVIKIINFGKYDIVHIQYPTVSYGKSLGINLLSLWLKIFTGAKLVYTTHEYFQNSFLGKLRQFLSIYYSDAVVTVDKESLKSISKIREGKSKYIPIASNIPKSNSNQYSIVRESILKGTDKKIMVHFGFLHQHRQFLEILEAISYLKQGNNLQTILLVIGVPRLDRDYHNEYYQKVNDYIRNHQLDNDIVFTGYLNDTEVADYINASDFAIALFEKGLTTHHGSYLALQQEGLSVISSFPSSSDEEFSNTVFTNSTPSVISKAILKFQTDPPKKSNNKVIDWHEVASQHLQLYNSISRPVLV